jgi:hypothetical protein
MTLMTVSLLGRRVQQQQVCLSRCANGQRGLLAQQQLAWKSIRPPFVAPIGPRGPAERSSSESRGPSVVALAGPQGPAERSCSKKEKGKKGELLPGCRGQQSAAAASLRVLLPKSLRRPGSRPRAAALEDDILCRVARFSEH